MTGYVRTDTTNNIADGNIINATDLDNEFDGIQSAFNSSTGHNHDGTTGEGAPILVLGPTQDVVVGASAVTPKTTNTVDVGSSSLKFKDLWLAGNASIGGTLAVTGVATLTAQPVLSSLTASRAVFTDGSKGLVSNAITGTGNVVMSASPTLTGTIGGENATLSGTLAVTGVATLTAQPIVSSLTASRAVFSDGSKGLVSNTITGTGNVVMSASPTLTGTINAEALTTSSTVTLNGGTANGVAYLNGSKVLTTGSALTFDGTNLGVGLSPVSGYKAAIDGDIWQGNTAGTVIGTITNNGGWYDFGASNNVNGVQMSHGAIARWLIGGSEQMRLTSTGLGIGTSSPGAKLDVVGTVQSNGAFSVNGTAVGSASKVWFGSDGGAGGFINVPSSQPLNIYQNNATLVAQFSASGNLGLGVTPPAIGSNRRALVIGGQAVASVYHYAGIGESAYNWYLDAASAVKYATTNYAGTFEFNNSATGGFAWKLAPSGTAGDAISFTQALTLDASGNLLVGTTSNPSGYRLKVNGLVQVEGANTVLNSGQLSSTATYIQSLTTGAAAADLVFFNTSEAARIDSSGNLLVGTTNTAQNAGAGIKLNISTASPEINVVGSASTNGTGTSYHLYSTGAAAYRFYVGYGGTVFATSTTISAISDQRLKENVQDLDVGLDAVMALKPRKFDWKEGKGKNVKGDRGWIAQEFEQVFPDMIDTWMDKAPEGGEPYKSVRADLIPVLVKAIQEQQVFIQTLTARVAALESN
jgi:hypothetical protein